ncbi:MAG: hypothetical protein DVB31_07715 [Verrucomicrobia bacterium]|nr:MAG: hypothetical protein DVB31_07715 [Verrucomicrobiota bacterium]
MRQLVLLLVVCLPALAGPLDFWTPQPALTNALWSDEIFANGRFVISIAGQNGAVSNNAILVSEDGAAWKRTREESASRFTAGNGLILAAVAGPAVISSVDGQSWIAKRLPVPWGIRSITFGLGRFWILNDTDPSVTLSSADGLTWDIVGTNTWGGSLVFCHDRFWTSGTANPLQSFDGTTFQPATNLPSFSSIAYLDGTWVAAKTDDASLAVSTNAIDWTTVSPSPFWARSGWVFSNGQRFIASTSANFFFESTNGLKWLDHQVEIYNTTTRFGLGGPRLVGGNNGPVLTGAAQFSFCNFGGH